MSLATVSSSNDLHARLHKFMSRPQRHRLLHGYPLAAAMSYADHSIKRLAADGDPAYTLPRNPADAVLVGVLPHPFCNPKIKGCGYCTFPHESFSALKSAAVVAGVVQEIEDRIQRQPELHSAPVSGLYFGGGTANLTPALPFRRLARKLAECFNVSGAEVSLEGVPRNFVRGEPLLLDIMREELPARHFRISMGIQTFSETRLEQMGRLGFGRPATFAAAVRVAHERGMTASGDLLCNLPGQSLEEMLGDVHQAIAIGLDQICVYHLVMFRGLGTAWSRSPAMLAGLPSNAQAANNWMALRDCLLASGYRQTSLTNFERMELRDDPRRYQYEPISYEANHCHVVGFGPGGISYAASSNDQSAMKTLNPESSMEYLQAVHTHAPVWNRYFAYQPQDLELLHLTRRLAALRIDKAQFSDRFGATVWDRYAERLQLLACEGLLDETSEAYTLTPRGMFYSDSIAALLADSRWQAECDDSLQATFNNNSSAHM